MEFTTFFRDTSPLKSPGYNVDTETPCENRIEEEMLAAVHGGDISTFTDMLNRKDELKLDLDFQDCNGDTLLKASIKEGYTVLVNLLLKHDVVLKDALLRAVDVGFVATIKTICAYAVTLPSNESRNAILDCQCDNDDFHPAVTPIILAAQRNDFAIVQILVEAGARIPESSLEEFETNTTDCLQRSVGLLEVYEGLASEAYCALANEDPVDNAFVLSDKLQKLSKTDTEDQERLLKLVETLNQLGTDIISQARSTEELLTVLSYREDDKKFYESEDQIEPLPKLSRAIKFDQRQFVAQSNCQQAVKSKFYGRVSYIRDRGAVFRFLYFISILLTFPVLSVAYLYVPGKWMKTKLECPYIKFAMHMSSDMVFVFLITADVLVNTGITDTFTMNRPTKAFLLTWIIGLGWQTASVIRKHKVSDANRARHVRNLLLVLTFLLGTALDISSHYMKSNESVNAIAVSSRSERDVAIHPAPLEATDLIHSTTNETDYPYNTTNFTLPVNNSSDTSNALINHIVPVVPLSKRTNVIIFSGPKADDKNAGTVHVDHLTGFRSRPWWHPSLLASAVFAIATVISVLRMLPYLVISDVIGPLEISLAAMFTRTYHVFIVLGIVMLAIAAGLTSIYSYYNEVDLRICISVEGPDKCSVGPLSNLPNVMLYLYWSMFGLVGTETLFLGNQSRLMETVGFLLYACFFVLIVLVFLNVLIAVMSNTYNEIEENSDVEWKFASTSMWMEFLKDGDVVPPPFNILPSISDVQHAKIYFIRTCLPYRESAELARQNRMHFKQIQTKRRKKSEKSQYRRVMSHLVERYIASKTGGAVSVQAEVTITDVRALRNELLTLKYEISKKIEKSIDDVGRTINKGIAVRQTSEEANSVFQRADIVHSLVDAHLKSTLTYKNEFFKTLAEIPPEKEPIATFEREAQTATLSESLMEELERKTEEILLKDSPMSSTIATQTTSDVHQASVQTIREHVSDAICQSNPLSVVHNVAIQTTSRKNLHRGTQVNLRPIQHDPDTKRKSNHIFKALSCVDPETRDYSYMYELKELAHNASQTPAPPALMDSISQTSAKTNLCDVSVQTAVKKIVDTIMQASVEIDDRMIQTELFKVADIFTQTEILEEDSFLYKVTVPFRAAIASFANDATPNERPVMKPETRNRPNLQEEFSENIDLISDVSFSTSTENLLEENTGVKSPSFFAKIGAQVKTALNVSKDE